MNGNELLLSDGTVTVVDSSRLSELKKYTWSLTSQGYPATNIMGRRVPLHNLILGGKREPGKAVDHINLNKLDNRLSNLRIVTRRQNNMNRGANKIRKDTEYKGVVLHSSGKWSARIGVDGKKISLGYYDTDKEAADAYDRAALMYHKDFAYVNDDELRLLLQSVKEKTDWFVTSSDDLLEKLPETTTVAKVLRQKPVDKDFYTAYTAYKWQTTYDSPLKALLKLTIALHESGELK